MRMIIGRSLRPLNSSRRMRASVGVCCRRDGNSRGKVQNVRGGSSHVSPGALASARGGRLFTTEVWTARGFVTFYTVFVIALKSRRVHVAGSTPYPDEAFVMQAMRESAFH